MTARPLGLGRPIRYGIALGPLLLLLIWSALSAAGALDRRVLSEPWTVVRTLGELCEDGRLQSHLLTSARRALLGSCIGVAAGTALALFSGLSRLGEALVDGPVQMKRSVPTLALIPLLILWFGIGETMKVLTVALAVTVPVYLHTYAGLRSIDARYVELAQTVHLTRAAFIRKVALPGALPGFLMGLRLAITSAWLAIVVVEQINATSGIGYMMSLARSYGQTEIIIVGLVVYGTLGFASDGVIRWVERRALSWRRTLAS
jgi:sulfonate transport system permease protein